MDVSGFIVLALLVADPVLLVVCIGCGIFGALRSNLRQALTLAGAWVVVMEIVIWLGMLGLSRIPALYPWLFLYFSVEVASASLSFLVRVIIGVLVAYGAYRTTRAVILHRTRRRERKTLTSVNPLNESRVAGSTGTGFSWRRTGWTFGLAMSVALNLALITKIVVFDPNTVLRPLCFRNSGPFAFSWPWEPSIEDVVGPPSKYFRGVNWLYGLPYRVGDDGTVYISLLDRYWHEELIWNYTLKMVRTTITENEKELDLPPLAQGERPDDRPIDCDLTRRIAIGQ